MVDIGATGYVLDGKLIPGSKDRLKDCALLDVL